VAVDVEGAVETTALWPQGDIRDPLGVWGFRIPATGDASGGSVKATAFATAGINAAYVYTLYSVNIAELAGTAIVSTAAKLRILTSWPNVSPIAGVQAYSSFQIVDFNGADVFTAPIAGQRDFALVQPNDRFLLIFDPRPGAGQLNMVELEIGLNTDLATYSFEGYGYYWDRSILQAPGGPRHPGAS